jgi:ADP-ribosylglycohydrolase
MFFSLPMIDALKRCLPCGPWRWTDDTQMVLSILEILARCRRIEQDTLAEAVARRFAQDSHRGYGMGAAQLLTRFNAGRHWRIEAPKLFGIGSFGNGGTMRAAPIGAYFAGDAQRAAHEAQLAAESTRGHIDSQAGAMAVTAAASLLAIDNVRDTSELLSAVASLLPACVSSAGACHGANYTPLEINVGPYDRMI